VVDHAIDRGGGSERILEDLVPLREDQIGSDGDTTPFIALGQEGKEHLHLFAALLDIADIVQDDDVKAVQAAQFGFQGIIPLGPQEAVDQLVGGRKEYAVVVVDPLVA